MANAARAGRPDRIAGAWLQAGRVLGVLTVALAAYQFVYLPATAAALSAEGIAFDSYWSLFMLYLAGLALAARSAPRALQRALVDGKPEWHFALGSVVAAVSGAAMSLAIDARGVGGETIDFYWVALGVLWCGSIAMVYHCHQRGKVFAVRDWTVYACAMALIPLSLVSSLPLWPLFFELDADQTVVTAATAAFAIHFLLAHYVIFEILERRERR